MDTKKFREDGKKLVDFIAEYKENIYKQHVFPQVKPQYLKDLIPLTAPEQPESYEAVIEDVKDFILPGVRLWLAFLF